MNPVGRNTVKISRFTEKAARLDEEPDFTFEHIIDLLRLMLMRRRVIAGRSGSIHQAALVAVTSSHHQRALALDAGADHFSLRHIFGLNVQRHGNLLGERLEHWNVEVMLWNQHSSTLILHHSSS